MDPAPVINIKPMAMNIRRNVRRNVHLVLLSDSLNMEEAVNGGFNEILANRSIRQSLKALSNVRNT